MMCMQVMPGYFRQIDRPLMRWYLKRKLNLLTESVFAKMIDVWIVLFRGKYMVFRVIFCPELRHQHF